MIQQSVILNVVLILLLTSLYSMSDDGNYEPKVTNQKASSVNVEAKAINTVKDRFGVDTGMTKEELEEFKKQYLDKAEELGILNFPLVSPKSYFEHKVNLDTISEIKKLGLFLTKDPFTPEESFAYNITHSDIIVIGTIDSLEYFYETEAEEWKEHTRSRYFVKVEEVLKGNEYYKNAPKILTFQSSNGRFLTSGEYKPKIGQKHIFFFQKISRGIVFDNDLCKMRFSSLRIEEARIYLAYSKKEFIKSYDEVLTLIKKYIEINDINSFYKRQYIEEDRNEK